MPLQIQVDSGEFINIFSKHVLKEVVGIVSLSPACVRRTGTRIDIATLIKVPGPSALSIDVWRMHGASITFNPSGFIEHEPNYQSRGENLAQSSAKSERFNVDVLVRALQMTYGQI